jgi:hypothetical protein
MPEPEPAAKSPKAPKRVAKAKKPKLDILAQLKKKYRLDDEVQLVKPDASGNKPGWGPLMNPQVFDKLASVDPTDDKRFLDWMLFQAGGAAPAFKLSLEMWGEGSKPMTPEQFMDKFNHEVPVRISANSIAPVIERLKEHSNIEVPELAQHSHAIVEIGQLNTDQERFQAIMALLNEQNLGKPQDRERIAKELLSHKLKTWIRNQSDTKVRDRVHAVYIYNRLAQGMTREEAEATYLKDEPELKREYVFGDQDNLSYRLFGFYREWPGGKEGVYEKVYNTMREFLINKERVEHRNAQLERINAAIQAKNQGVPPEDQMPLREPIDISLDIGKVSLDRKMHLQYTGPYPSLSSLSTATEQIMDLPMRERVGGDIRYAGQKSKSGPKEKLYSDANLDVMVPLTVAAAVKSGHKSWKVADPEQLDVRSSGHHGLSTWTQWAAGHHNHPEWEGSQAVPVYFVIKDSGTPVFRVMLIVFMADLISLKPPYIGTLWQLQGSDKEVHFGEMVQMLKAELDPQVYIKAIRSFTNGLKVLRQWGQEFDPAFEMTGDYVAHHRAGLQGRPNLRSQIIERARQIIELLID